MVFAGRQDGNVAAVVPKIYFYKPFAKLRIYNKQIKYSIDYKQLISQLDYQKLFILHGSLDQNSLLPNKNGEILLEIPINTESNILSLSVEHEETKDSLEKLEINFINSSTATQFLSLGKGKINSLLHINLDKNVHSSSRFLINNAGSDFRDSGTPYDLALDKKTMDSTIPRDMSSVMRLLRSSRRFIHKEKNICFEFFAYFEDTELSNWINKNNYKIHILTP